MTQPTAAQPVLILGGFLIASEAYGPMADGLRDRQGVEVEVVPVSRADWLLTVWAIGWRRLLDRVDDAVRRLQARSPSGRITLIGHSSGAVMLRLFLGPEPFAGRVYDGRRRCNRLVMLGGPHQAVRATPLRALVDRRYPGCPFADQVDYVSVAGRLNLEGSSASALSRRGARRSYRTIAGDAADGMEGDGLVPVASALLADSRQLVLEDTAHGRLFGDHWYGSPERLSQWWPFVLADPPAAAAPGEGGRRRG
ncbi:esterase [Synechococcus sp. RSCCF101]|uniref:esterase/lipase family protein n=1 Tax=Synechococcus sp. RSCCF101 TaxID=2511069 RepID=UPI001243C649|nr:esterase [Synechococcus sp. RSCCF101]QEY31269.1 esterase [Synechococcus sp. RSCCF101]